MCSQKCCKMKKSDLRKLFVCRRCLIDMRRHFAGVIKKPNRIEMYNLLRPIPPSHPESGFFLSNRQKIRDKC